MNRPLLAVSMGDPAGIGPEIVVRACANPSVNAICRPIIVGDAGIIDRARKATGLTGLGVNVVTNSGRPEWSEGALNVLDLHNVDLSGFQPGVVDAMCGRAAHDYIVRAADLALSGKVGAIVTAPIHKEAIHLAGIEDAGHAEILARHTRTADYAAMLVDGRLRVVHVSTHVSLRQAIDLVTMERVLQKIRLTHKSLQALGFARPNIAVAGLNPHCGESGLFGDEEIRAITPAVEAAAAEGITVSGPIPPDTVFVKARGGLYDAVVAMYHDQGHIPIKDGAFSIESGKSGVSGVNVTLGLPIIRTSVDHGTAFDIAWRGTADAASLVAAIELAVAFLARRG